MNEAGIRTFAQVAVLAGRQKRTMARTLIAMHIRDKETGAPTDWLERFGHKWMVNLARFERAHPSLFSAKYVSRDEFDEMSKRLDEVEAKQSETRMRVNAVASRVRELAGKVGT
jgi:hypothetical protein